MTASRPIDRGATGNLTQELVRIVTDQIQRGELRPGDRLPTEGALAGTYGVSRTVVREAVSRLNAAGLVQTQHGRGSYVLTAATAVPFEVSAGDVRTVQERAELLDFRLGVEVEAAGLAASVRTSAELAQLRTELGRFQAASERPSESIEADAALHRAVARASHNRYFVAVLDSLGPAMIVTPRSRLEPGAGDARLSRVSMEHQNIVEAIERGRPDDARAAMRVHLSNSRSRLLTP